MAIPANYNSIKLIGNVSNYRISLLCVSYPDNIEVDIYVKTYKYMNPVDVNRIWNLELYKKESAQQIILYSLDYPNKFAVGN